MASRSTLEDEENSTVTRPGWLEASYTTPENDCYLTPGEFAEDLVRGYGNSHRFRIEWTSGTEPTDYIVVFNMNTRSIGVKVDDGSGYDAIDGPTPGPSRHGGEVYDLSGRKINGQWPMLPKGIYIINGKKVMVK